MMQDPDIVVAIDVGTSKVCTIVARKEDNRGFRMLSHSVVPSEGIEKGNVTDVAATQGAITASVTEAARIAAVTVKEAYVGVTGSHISYENRHDQLRWATKRGVITTGELLQVPNTVAASSRQDGRRVLHALPRNYMLDGQRGIRNPLGMHTSRLEVETHVILGASEVVEKLTLAVEQSVMSDELRALNRRPVDGVECCQADIADLDAIRPAFDGIDVVVHLAAFLGGDDWEGQLSGNVIGVYNVYEAARLAGVRRVVFASSGATTLGPQHHLSPYREMASGVLLLV